MMSEDDYLLDEVYKEIDLMVNTAEDEDDAITSILESPYPFDEEQAMKLIKRFKKINQPTNEESKDGKRE